MEEIQIESCKGWQPRLAAGCEVGLLQKLQLGNAREDAALSAVVEVESQALQVFRIERVVNVIGQVVGHQRGGEAQLWGPGGRNLSDVLEPVIARALKSLDYVGLGGTPLHRCPAHRPERKDKRAPGP